MERRLGSRGEKKTITKRDALIAFIFTIVEIVTLTAWLAVVFPNSMYGSSPALIVLGIGLYVEHLISRLKG